MSSLSVTSTRFLSAFGIQPLPPFPDDLRSLIIFMPTHVVLHARVQQCHCVCIHNLNTIRDLVHFYPYGIRAEIDIVTYSRPHQI